MLTYPSVTRRVRGRRTYWVAAVRWTPDHALLVAERFEHDTPDAAVDHARRWIVLHGGRAYAGTPPQGTPVGRDLYEISPSLLSGSETRIVVCSE